MLPAPARPRGPVVRGGDGRGPTVPQRRLLEALNARLPGWRTELAVATGSAPGSGWPTVLKLDLGHRAFKMAVEIDGRSHRALTVREADARKTALLETAGWTVVRVGNGEVLADPLGIAVHVLAEAGLHPWAERLWHLEALRLAVLPAGGAQPRRAGATSEGDCR